MEFGWELVPDEECCSIDSMNVVACMFIAPVWPLPAGASMPGIGGISGAGGAGASEVCGGTSAVCGAASGVCFAPLSAFCSDVFACAARDSGTAPRAATAHGENSAAHTITPATTAAANVFLPISAAIYTLLSGSLRRTVFARDNLLYARAANQSYQFSSCNSFRHPSATLVCTGTRSARARNITRPQTVLCERPARGTLSGAIHPHNRIVRNRRLW